MTVDGIQDGVCSGVGLQFLSVFSLYTGAGMFVVWCDKSRGTNRLTARREDRAISRLLITRLMECLSP